MMLGWSCEATGRTTRCYAADLLTPCLVGETKMKPSKSATFRSYAYPEKDERAPSHPLTEALRKRDLPSGWEIHDAGGGRMFRSRLLLGCQAWSVEISSAARRRNMECRTKWCLYDEHVSKSEVARQHLYDARSVSLRFACIVRGSLSMLTKPGRDCMCLGMFTLGRHGKSDL